MAHLKKRALTAAQCRKMLSDAREGEKKMTEDDAEIARLQEELGMFSAGTPAMSPDTGDGVGATRKQKPFQRKPARDPVGNDDDHAP